MSNKKTHVKPAFYSYCYEELKVIAKASGYNLVLHGSAQRDLDLILIPWDHTFTFGDPKIIVQVMADFLGGTILEQEGHCYRCGMDMGLGRKSYVINLNRGGHNDKDEYTEDPQWYLDISVTPIVKS